MDKKKKRKHNLLYRARRLGAQIDTKTCSIYRPFGAATTPNNKSEVALIKEFQFGIQFLIQ